MIRLRTEGAAALWWRAFLHVVVLVAALGGGSLARGGGALAQDTSGGSILKPPAPVTKPTLSRADVAVRQLERLPWPVHVLQVNLGKDRPVAIEGFYLMRSHLLLVTHSGMVYCLDRRNLEPRWVAVLKAPLFRPPAEGPEHFTFLVKDYRGVYWLHAFSKRSGAEGADFPVRLPFSASAGAAVDGAVAYLASLGNPANNKTLETVNLVTGRAGWGYRARGILRGAPQADPDGGSVVFATDGGMIVSLPSGAVSPASENWTREIGGLIRGGVALSPQHVVVGNSDSVLYNLDLDSGEVLWMRGVRQAVTTSPWVFASWREVQKPSTVEGAAPVTTRQVVGSAFVRNAAGLFAFDLGSGTPLFHDPSGGRPLAQQGGWLLVISRDRVISFRDTQSGYRVRAHLQLGALDLLPSNPLDGTIYGCTSDGTLVAAVPR